jgi:hypothetical protein
LFRQLIAFGVNGPVGQDPAEGATSGDKRTLWEGYSGL